MHVMKSALANLALISGLVASVVVGDALPPEDIPVECATICGPIIELTSKCTGKWQRLVKRDQDAIIKRREWVPKLAVEPPERDATKGIKQREVIIFLPSPDRTTTTSSTSINLQPTTVPTRITPVPESSTSTSTSSSLSSSSVAQSSPVQSTPASAEPPTSTSTVTTLVTFTRSTETTATQSQSMSESGATMTSTLQIPEPQGQLYMQDNGEEDCVCLASSFDVAKVTALCSSCVAQNGFSNENIEIIMDGCNFTSLSYTISDDRVVDNVRVDAVGPSSSSASSAAQFAARNAPAVWGGFILAVAVMV